MRLFALAGLAALALASPGPASPADTPSPGYRIDPRPYPGGVLAKTLSDGDVVTFDQKTVARWDSDGTFLMTLASFGTCDPFVFPPSDCLYGGIFEISPDETFLLFGESSFGDVYRVDLLGGGKTLLANVPLNYDAAFEDATHAIVSAANAGFTANELRRLDTTTGALELVADLVGFSGPVAVDSAGSLFYGSQQAGDVLRFTWTQTHSGVTLTDADATVFASGFDLASQLVAGVDPDTVYLAESDYFTGASTIWELGPTPATSRKIVESPAFQALGSLQFHRGIRGAEFLPFQPAFGGSLHYTTRDFVAVAERYEVRPARPQAVLSGPGLGGVGQVDFTVTGASPLGIVLVLYGPQPLYNAVETAYTNPGLPPLFTGMDLVTTKVLPLLFFADPAGQTSFGFEDDGTLNGMLALQAVVGNSFGALLGTSTTALN